MPNPISRMSIRAKSRRACAQWVLLAAIAAAFPALARIASATGLPAAGASTAPAEDGYRLWLRYVPVESEWLLRYRASARELIAANEGSPALRAAQAELLRGLTGLLGTAPDVAADVTRDGAILFGTPHSSVLVNSLSLDLRRAGTEGYLIRTVSLRGHRATVIAANTDVGVLHGAFGFLRLLQTREPIAHLDIAASPRFQRRVLDHWDNLNGTVERGYAGDSIWKWETLPEYLSQIGRASCWERL